MAETGSDVVVENAVSGFSDDLLMMSVHAATHWDALSHVFHHGHMYNGRPCSQVTSAGAKANSIVGFADRVVTRGVLVDAPRHFGVDALPPDHELTTDELGTILDAQRVGLEPGDVLLLRTGQLGRIAATGDWSNFTEVGDTLPREPGVGLDCLPWLQQMGVAAIAADTWAVEHLNGESTRLPVHEVAIVHMGLPLGEIFVLDELAAACAEDGCYDFLLAAGPLPLAGGVGGPVNPVAIR
jgi:kynurenine formamidase